MVPSAISFLFVLLRISLCASPCRAPADVDSFSGDQPGCRGYPEEEGEGSIDNRVRHRRLHPLQLALQGVDLGGGFGLVCLHLHCLLFFLSFSVFPSVPFVCFMFSMEKGRTRCKPRAIPSAEAPSSHALVYSCADPRPPGYLLSSAKDKGASLRCKFLRKSRLLRGVY